VRYHQQRRLRITQDDLLAYAHDADGDTLTASNLQGENVTITANTDGTFSVTPDPDFNGQINLTFDVNDGTTSVASTMTLNVEAKVAVAFELLPGCIARPVA
jgi:hypothetical protein